MIFFLIFISGYVFGVLSEFVIDIFSSSGAFLEFKCDLRSNSDISYQKLTIQPKSRA